MAATTLITLGQRLAALGPTSKPEEIAALRNYVATQWTQVQAALLQQLDEIKLEVKPPIKKEDIKWFDPTELLRRRKLEQGIYELLSNREWYSYRVDAAVAKLGTTDALFRSEAIALGQRIGDPVNFFVYSGVEYVGLASRGRDYDADAAAGTNHIVKLIEAGAYK